ncbi:MAG: YwaF family protein [Clostridia bacterium]|nr:YwaF family protein [Clostridia bacterium]
MGKLMIFNFILIGLIAFGIWLIKKCVKQKRTQNIILCVAAIFTILFHYSTFIYKLVSGGNAIEYLSENHNLILPIYPCNVVMWAALLFPLLKNKKSGLGIFLADYLFWFGLISTLVGMFANVDFINNPTLADYENIKSIAAHATLLFNVILIALFGYIKIDVKRNIKSIILSILAMAVIGCYCNLVFYVLVSKAAAYDVNSMFLIHSPFEGVEFLTYPVISLIAVPIYLTVFVICDLCAHKKGERFYNKAGK